MQVELIERDGMLCAGARILLVVGDDVKTFRATSPVPEIIEALYDAHQVQDNWSDGTEFLLDGKVIARVEGIHVVEA